MTNNQRAAARIYLMNEIQLLTNAYAPVSSTEAEVQHFCMMMEAEIHYLKEALLQVDIDVLPPEFLGNHA